MIRELVVLTLVIFLFSNISATCDSDQIDINTASLEELDKITGIGPVYAGRIIQGRPFSSVDDLTKVNGIGEKTLEKIKAEGLACVENEVQDSKENDSEDEEINNTEADEEKTKTIIPTAKAVANNLEEKPETINLTPISLNSKSIKSEDNKEVLNKNLALYGVMSFGAISGALFLVKKARRKNKNEFR